MDYDENDFQNQNFELTREDTGKFPSILRPFSLPKFDIDEPLNVPVRFDPLPEPDCLFTITGLCSGSNWINDFSPQNSTTKTKNVWSEATSSESVEMLLKSVREEEPVMDGGGPRESLNGTDYSHMMDVDPSSSMLDPSDDRQMRSSIEECITEEKHLENSLDSTKLPESSDGLLEAITYPIRNLNKEMQSKEISPLAERYGIDTQFENVSYPRIGTPLMGSEEQNKELSDEILNMGEKEKSQLETEQSVMEDSAKTKDHTSSTDERNQKDMAVTNDEQGVIGKERSSMEGDVISITDKVVVSDGAVPDSLKSQSNEQITTRDDSAVSDAMKEQPGADHTEEVATPLSVPAQDSLRPCDLQFGKGKEVSRDLSDSATTPKGVFIGSVSKEMLVAQEEDDKHLTCPPPSTEVKSSPITSETELDSGKASTISADVAQGSNPCTEDIAKDDSATAGTCADNNQSSTELTCGSPTVISGCLDETKEDGASDDPVQDANKGKHGSEGSNRDTAASEDDKSFSFNVVANVPERETVPDWKPFSSMKASDNATPSKETAKAGALHGNTTKNKSEVTASDVKPLKTEAKKPDPSPKKKRERKKAQSVPSPRNLGTTRKHPEGSSGSGTVKTPSSASGLPDLNASATSAQLAHQPFTDLQHVQLRAQIFVYGSLIQGVPPSEAYMVSAFGDSAGGRKKWEAAWHTAMEKYQNQKSPLSASTPGTPDNSQPVHRSTESVPKESAVKRKSSIPANKASIKSQVPATTTVPSASPMPPASLPRGGTHLDFTQNVSPSPMYNPYQPLQVKHQPPGTASPWLSPSHSNPWLLPTQSSVFKTTSVSTIPAAATISTTAEASKITPRRKTPSTSVPLPPSLPVVLPPTSFPAIPSPVSTIASIAPVSPPSSVLATLSAPISIGATDAQKITVVSPLPTVTPTMTPKSRKRKKASATLEKEPEKPQVSSPPALINTTSLSSPQPKIIFTGQLASDTSLVTTTSPMLSYPVLSANIPVGLSEHNKITFPEDTTSRIEQSKLHAEDAAAQAAAAVKYSQNVWSELAAQRNSGLTSDVEQKLASAAVAAAAAASVAKAAAAAAKVASEAALQAKIMAEESMRPLTSEKTGPIGSVQNSFIAMARETAKKRVEAASAAAKRAENLDAVIRAAEVAAEALSQAGVVVAMGDPLPLGIKELLEAGPDEYWKVHFFKAEKEKQLPAATSSLQFNFEEARSEDHEKIKDKISSTPQVIRKTDAGKTIDVPGVSEKDIAGNELPSAKEKDTEFQKGSQIEVFVDEAGFSGVWFHATVLDVEENRVHVCYTDRFADEELGQVKEWIALRNEGDKPPRVRAAHPATGPKPEGTRKRRREAVGTTSWAIGDHVDAWIRDGWREGIVTEKSDGDGSKYTVQFLVAGGSSVVEPWHLRPSLIWHDGQWSLWSRSIAKKTLPKEGESPYEKRQRFGQLESDLNQVTTSANTNTGPGPHKRSEDSRPLNLPSNEKVLPMGKFTIGETNSLKRAGPGPQKEGSRVVFGVPRPGKKKKYMDVSKHYDGEKPDNVAATTTEANSNPSVKHANYLMPQNRAPKTKTEPKAKEAADSKQRAGSKSGKSHALSSSETSLDSLPEQRAPPRKKLGTSNEHDAGGKGKTISSDAGNADKSLADLSEPRRSIRRIQPTSRLLEGLQSSLMIAKMPTDKGTRTAPKGGVPSKGRFNG